MSARNAALSAYKNALRATKIAFANDIPILAGARSQIKQGFLDSKDLADSKQIEDQITHLNDVSKFLIKNVVQGQKQPDGKYFLNFHEKTELGDNESIKQHKLGSLSGKKCTDLKK
jgi:complex III assembly factor LYRM7